ncbi:hypothetical protein [Nocardioides daejeonensis]|uniref:hypothetical protein n=1 Tax=Nocardioides daejeonensis TaxID=1046556 RepID=UPI000D743D2E|nr:hypothetical protein [Nocardioides daejeonensis]
MRRAAATALALVAGALTGVALAPPTTAAEVSTTVEFAGCEVRYRPYAENTRVGAESTWSPSLTFRHPTPIPTNDMVTTEVELGALPGNTLPESLKNVRVSVDYLEFKSEHWNPLRFYAEFTVPALDHTQSLAFPEMEYDTDYGDPGIYDYRVKSIDLLFTGEDLNGEFAEYAYRCDQIVNPRPLFTLGVYDLAATPAITLSQGTVRQGGSVRITGTGMLAAAPTQPPAQVEVAVGGTVMGRYPLDASGSFAGVLPVPPFASPGSVTVRAVNGTKSATAALEVLAGKGRVSVAPKKVRSGKAVTVTGSSYRPGERVTVSLKGGSRAGRKSFAKSVTASADGTFKASIKLKKAARGKWKVSAIGSSSKRSARANLKVK